MTPNLRALLERHPAPWVCDDEDIGFVTDSNGEIVFIGSNGIPFEGPIDGWQFAVPIVALVNAAAESETHGRNREH